MNPDKSYHQVIVKSDFPTNTGPVKLYSRVINVKWDRVEDWKAANPKLEVTKVIDIIRN